MIPRYSRPEMSAIWSEESKFQIWFEIEAHACDAQAKLGVIPSSAAATIWEKGAFQVNVHNEIIIVFGNFQTWFSAIDSRNIN